MKRFNTKGMMIFPQIKKGFYTRRKELLVVAECFCPNGHNLIDKKAMFYNFPGIILKVKTKDKQGFIALSPVYNDKSRISLDVDITDGDLLEIVCPHCDAPLPVFSDCSCGGKLVTLFLDKNHLDFSNCIGVCNRVGCIHAELKSGHDIRKHVGFLL